MSSSIIFIVLAAVLAVASVGVVLFKNPINSTLSMLVVTVCVAGFYALLSSSFLFMAQIIIYAGAVIVLILFVLMFLGIKDKDLPEEGNMVGKIIVGLFFLIPIDYVILKNIISMSDNSFSFLSNSKFGSLDFVGVNLFNDWVLVFELISILLTVAIVGAVILIQKKRVQK